MNKYASESKRVESRMCRAKVFYQNAVDAKAGLERTPKAHDFYKCLYCPGWHLTSRLPRGNVEATP